MTTQSKQLSWKSKLCSNPAAGAVGLFVRFCANGIVLACFSAGSVLITLSSTMAQSLDDELLDGTSFNGQVVDVLSGPANGSPMVLRSGLDGLGGTNRINPDRQTIQRGDQRVDRRTGQRIDGNGNPLITGGIRRQIGPGDPVGNIAAVGTPAAAQGTIASAAGPSFSPDASTNPFDPTPLRFGSFNVNGELTLTGGYSTNLSQSSGGNTGRFGRSRFTGSATSDWGRHQLRLSSQADVDLTGSGVDRNLDIDLRSDLRLDLSDATTATLTGVYGAATEAASSPDASVTGSDNPILHTLQAGAVLERQAGVIGLQLRGQLEATRYSPIRISGQPVVSQAARNQNNATLGLRATYDGGGRLTPYADIQVTRGDRVTALDSLGFNRRYLEMRGTVGANAEFSGVLSGSLEAGYNQRRYADVRLPDLKGAVINGSLNYQPSETVELALNLGTSYSGAAQTGVSGSVAYNAGATINWGVRDNLDLSLTAGATQTRYSNGERDLSLTASGQASYWITPHFGVTGEVSTTRLTTNRVGAAFSASAVELGVKLRH